MSSHPAFRGACANTSYIPTLDGWRTIAVSLVVGNHAITYLRETGWPGVDLLIRLLGHGGVGVDIFFALSGYLISTLLLAERERAGHIQLGSFYVRRVFRIMPPIAVYLTCLIALRGMGLLTNVNQEELVASLFFFRNYIDTGSWYTSHFWSLAVEEHFYLIIPWILVMLSPRRAGQALAGLALACIVSRWLVHEWHLYQGFNVEFRTENRVDALMWGAFLAVMLRADEARHWLQKHLSGLRMFMLTAIAAVLMVLWPDMPFRRTVVALVLPLLVIHTVLHPTAWWSRPLEWSAARWLGRRSYSLYIWQMLFFVDLPRRDLPAVQTLSMALVASILCAMASYRFVEKPMIRLGHRLSARTARIDRSVSEAP